MRLFLPVLFVAGLAGAEGIPWTGDVKKTLDRARRDNLPVLIAINALDNEGGNMEMAFTRYKNKDLVAASRLLLCLVASPSDHSKKTCARFGSIQCKYHQEVLRYAVRRWAGPGGNLVSPQHFILAPDGTVFWRKEYWAEAKTLQRQIEKALVKYAPLRALELAGSTRAGQMDKMRAGTLDPDQYLQSGDPLAAAALLLLYEEEEEAKWLKPLERAGKEAWRLVRIYLEEDKALLPVAKAIDATRAAWWEKYHSNKPGAVPPPTDKKLAAALKAFVGGDKKSLTVLLDAWSHPIHGAEVRASLRAHAGEDYGREPDAWREALAR
ncbi:MAG: hypothetical protein OER88_00020 [Planctomycetota bacterium]|nr:hypothetical protein [Planctomycetota bacterium]